MCRARARNRYASANSISGALSSVAQQRTFKWLSVCAVEAKAVRLQGILSP